MDGLADDRADGRGTEEAIRRAVGLADGRSGWPGRTAKQLQGRTPVGTAASVRRAVGLADGCPGKTVVRRAVGYADGWADGQRTTRRTGGYTSTSRNGHLQHRDPKPPPSAGRLGFYPGVKLTKSGCQRMSPPLGERPTSGTSDVLTTLPPMQWISCNGSSKEKP